MTGEAAPAVSAAATLLGVPTPAAPAAPATAAPAAAVPATAAPAAKPETFKPGGTRGGVAIGPSGLSAEQHLILAEDMVRKGHLTREQANEAVWQGWLDDGLITREQFDEARASGEIPRANTGALSPEIHAYLAEQGQPPAKSITEYQMPFDGDGPHAAEADKWAREILLAGGFSPSNGSALASEIERAGAATERMTPVAREIWAREQHELVTKVLGANAAERIALARQLVSEIDARRPGLKRLLDHSGIGNSANVVYLFVQQAEMLARREQR